MNDLQAPLEYIKSALRSQNDVVNGIGQLIQYCERNCPSSAWTTIQNLDFSKYVVHLENWLTDVLSNEPPNVNIKAFWCGVFIPIYSNEPSCDMYLSGSQEFDPENITFDRAGWAEESYIPQKRYAKSEILHEIYKIVQEEKIHDFPSPCPRKGLCSGINVCWLGEYVLCLGYACLSISQVLKAIEPELILGGATSRAFAVGYDSGDALLLGNFNIKRMNFSLNTML